MVETQNSYDVVIVGGGLVGIALACALGDQPLRVAVIEALPFETNRSASYDDRTIALAYGARPIFEAMGVWQQLAADVTAIKRIHISDRGHFGAARLDCNDVGCEALGYVVPSRCMGEVLMARVAQFDNVELLCPARVTSLEQDEHAATIVIEREGEQQMLRSGLLVVADGTHSAIREQLQVAVDRHDYGQRGVIANVTPSRHHDNVAFERFTDSGPMAMLPMDESRCALVWTVSEARADELLTLDDEAFLAELQDRFGNRLGRFEKVGNRAAHSLMQIVAQEQVRDRLALIGNAAHTLHPVAGQGFNLGLRDVAVLADLINTAAVSGEDVGSATLLADYAEWRRNDQRYIIGFTDSLVRLFASPLLPIKAARSAGLVALDLLPPLKRWLTRHAMGLGGKLPRLSRGLPLQEK
ncbi:2-octaprenyl-6-methoxyphenyl hydroxylase [Solemya pervernicosa gill symbiont]|uniref:2-octaprenyl-6-methoxyphenyl hydroxylase n=2 Tax=Gammaproteobacteria incertae sedis TaxID=118884 RepID=A0A1T2L3B4_9GAMM|nr:2-octaprenyl-6-methoxyphenyl hydroxylase [Candidatus Reidiella endopervernicosa]OOZ39490.1 2-octaprenyl-6-methoxyphenyl hydroxylase [Solemya pervernicosa gill symbiont]QKQ25885.1 2-octaprenyl-6-methoxyphenyl hydroxylase [Candidatus Reidiella endopervernicosa]